MTKEQLEQEYGQACAHIGDFEMAERINRELKEQWVLKAKELHGKLKDLSTLKEAAQIIKP